MKKKFKLSADQLKPLAFGFGGCVASDRIAVDGASVGFMRRDVPIDPVDSGWLFLAGDENAEYTVNNANFGIYDVNTIANFDPSILPFLEASVRSAFTRSEGGDFVEVEYDQDDSE